MDCGSFCACCMRLIAHRMDAAGIDPAVIEIEQRANRDGVVDGFVRVADRMQRFDVRRAECETESPFTFRTKRNSAFSGSDSEEVSRSASTPSTSSLLPSNSAATAACDFVQNGHWFRCDV